MMGTAKVVLVLVFSVCLVQTISVETNDTIDKDCHIWYQYDNYTKQCKCGSELNGAIQCNEEEKIVSIRVCYCMTLDNLKNEVVIASCFYTCDRILNDFDGNHILTEKVTANTTRESVNKMTCGRYHRQGMICGECKNEYGRPVYSYDLSCVKCTNYKYNWLKYIAVAYLPLTIFYFAIILFRISANAGSMVGYVTISQLVGTPGAMTLFITIFHQHASARAATIFYSLWNLDFFRSVYPPFCLHPNLSALQVLSLDYLVAIYPMLLVFLTYLIVQLHSYSKIVSNVCEPLYRCLHYFRKEWDVRTSLIEALATLLLLSYVKILHVSFNMMIPNYPYYRNGKHGYPLVYNDPNTRYLSKAHLPYFLLAILMSFTFNIAPLLLLCLYPCGCFHKCLRRLRLNHPALHSFMDAFQGCYRSKPHFLRSFHALYLTAQIINLIIFFFLENIQYLPGTCYMLIVMIIVLGIARPFKNKWHNRINISLFLALLLTYFSFIVLIESNLVNLIQGNWGIMNQAVAYIGALTPPLYGLGLLTYRVVPSRAWTKITHMMKMCKSDRQTWNDSLPHRLQYDEIIPPRGQTNNMNVF